MISKIKERFIQKIFSIIELYFAYKKKDLLTKFKACGTHVTIDEPSCIKDPDKISIGSHVYINAFCHFWGFGGITIGNNVMIASHCALTSITHSKHTQLFEEKNVLGQIIIEDNVWIGSHVVILPGITIGKNSIIGAGAIVNKDVAPNSVYVGVPAQKIETLTQFR